MIDLRQKELAEWQGKNYGDSDIEDLAEMAVEQANDMFDDVRDWVDNEYDAEVDDIIDGASDTMVLCIQIMSILGADAEKRLAEVIDDVLQRGITK